MFCGDTSAGRSTGLSRFELLTVRDTATDIFYYFTKSGTHGNFHKTGVLDLTTECEYLGSFALLGTHGCEPFGTV